LKIIEKDFYEKRREIVENAKNNSQKHPNSSKNAEKQK